jgi:hypothetical protein
MMTFDKAKSGALLLGVAVVAFLAWRAYKAAPEAVKAAGEVVEGIATGNNALTQTATNAEGERVTAYEGAGIVGTVGAAANAASGGHLATWGGSLGSWIYDMTHDDYDPNAPAPAFTGGASGSW